MLNEYERERVRRAFYLEKKSIYQIAKEEGYSHQAIEKALFDPLSKPYHLSQPKPAPIFGTYLPRVEALLGENEHLPRKQRYTSHKIFEILQKEGYQGGESGIRRYLARRKKQANQVQEVFLPLEFEPGQDAQVDWGEAIALLGGQRQKVQFFLMRLCYSRRAFAMAFPSQAQECFLYAHLCAFKHFGGVPHRISYDNLGTAVKIEPTKKRGRPRQEVQAFRARREVTLKAYPFTVEIWDGTERLSSHPRSYEREQDLFDPLHYLCLLERKPGAFDFAKPMKQWKADWPESYHRMLRVLRETWPDGRGIQEFVRVLQLHQQYPSELLEQAIEQALAYGCVHLDGVISCLRQLNEMADRPGLEKAEPLDGALRPDLVAIGNQPVDLSRYERLLKLSW